MLEPIDIAMAVHKYCELIFIPKGISPPHDVSAHSAIASYYAKVINAAGLGHVTGEQVWAAMLDALEWDMETPWPGHPHPDKVIEFLTATN